jgi:hypothetical protein
MNNTQAFIKDVKSVLLKDSSFAVEIWKSIEHELIEISLNIEQVQQQYRCRLP